MTTPPKGRADHLALGDWNVVCYECGRKRKASYMKRHWQGYYVCPEHWEPRHPQDFVHGIPDVQTPPWTQPMPADQFVPINYTEYSNDQVPLLELAAKFFIKQINDIGLGSGAINAQEVNGFSVNGAPALPPDFERFVFTESFLVTIGRSFSESLNFTETLSASSSKGLSEPAQLVETSVVNFTKTVPMVVIPADGLVNGATLDLVPVNGTTPLANNPELLTVLESVLLISGKGFAEVSTLSEALAKTIVRNLAEAFTLGETVYLQDVERTQESLGVSETKIVSSTKALPESLGIFESVTTTIQSRNVVDGAAVNTTILG